MDFLVFLLIFFVLPVLFIYLCLKAIERKAVVRTGTKALNYIIGSLKTIAKKITEKNS